MRSEKEMFDLILKTADNDSRIRAVYMNGSRTNPSIKKDIFQDYDIVYVVTEIKTFLDDENWIDIFGERLYMQLPEAMDNALGKNTDLDNCYGWLIQLADGNRIDLHLQTESFAKKEILKDKLCIILMDKDKLLPDIPPASDIDYHVKKPAQIEFSACCNEFWWIFNNVGKGLWRDEITYATDMINFYIRPELVKMLSWYIGIKTDFSCSVGKSGKYMSSYLEKDIWDRFLKTYSAADIESLWNSVFITADLFDEIAVESAHSLNYTYDTNEARNSRTFLLHTFHLPKDAKEIL
ncbi:aminoglycoside 6-adenylyltransferase [Sebaldella sp. S0638]|uniref:aminoglycoside 6-adenylyltransferase n=1 Tax=Sebaldella sp. S0638 TaxID=2957809 RepID=UPI00209F9DDD|nr:aminoglycoside 6-adenylyltransferase [Sebaldella sp. S0638]MCP1223181.1 aminoglycoside 6-adenylyltransferase [Sebaldella sp. S0638]